MPEFSNEFIQQLLVRRALGKALSAEENEVLVQWAGESAYRRAIIEQVGDAKVVGSALEIFDSVDEERLWARTKLFVPVKIVHRVHFLRTAWFRYAAILFVLFTGLAVYWQLQIKERPRLIVSSTKPVQIPQPGSDKAILILSDGKKVELGANASSTIVDGALSISNQQGHLVYADQGIISTNTMTTPKGGQYQLTLADGTRVWLNAASSITYPTAFTGAQREVSVTGEAYFEVKADKARPFIVQVANGAPVQVLGTSFNIHAYADEVAQQTTLIEGSVKVGVSDGGVVLQPGQQGEFDPTTLAITKQVAVNTAQITAWKKGYFDFNGLHVPEVMRQLARWYDLDVRYAGEIPGLSFVGKIERSASLGSVLKGLEGAGLHFTIDGRTITVSP